MPQQPQRRVVARNQARLWMKCRPKIRRAISSFIFVDAPPSNLYHLKKLVGWSMASGIHEAAELAMMARVLDAYCQSFEITDPVKREALASRILLLFEAGGQTEEGLASALDETVKRYGGLIL